MSNIPGAPNVLPSVVTDVVTQSRGASVPGGTRIAAIIGEGSRGEVLVSSALGGGSDGLNSSYTSATGSDGRHFALSLFPVISARTRLFKNGAPLTGLEQDIDSDPFDNRYDYRIEIDTGRIELQTAHLVDQSGAFYKKSASNTGVGTIQNLSLEDLNAPTETWTVKCISVQRNSSSVLIAGTAKFIAFGSVSGIQVDANGNPIVWIANNEIVDNSILRFSILETSSFSEGDSFTIKVSSGVLSKNDSLTVEYIALTDLNDPTFFTSMEDITNKHGSVSTDNTLSLGCQLAFANSTPGVMCLQAAPAIPRRTSYNLQTAFNAASSEDDVFVLPLPYGVTPNLTSEIHFFVTNPSTGVETEVLPNKLEYYTLGTSGYPSVNSFIFDDVSAPSGYSFFYSVIKGNAALNFAADGYIDANLVSSTQATFSSSTVVFDSSYVGMNVKVEDATNSVNIGEFEIISVNNGEAVIQKTGAAFISETSLNFEVNDPDTESDYIVVNHNVIPNGYSLRVTMVTDKDASFYDAGWLTALDALELSEVDIVVPLPKQTISVIFQNTLSHCRTMSNLKNKKERVLFIGAIRGLIPEFVLGEESAAVEDIGVLEGIQGDDVNEVLAGNVEDLADYSVANAYGNTFRCVYFYPDEIVVQVGTDATKLDGFYLAAAAAGFLSGTPNIAIPLTNKTLSGFTILKTKQFKNIILEQLAVAGLTVVKPVSGGGNVIWGKTTTQSGFAEEEEISIVFIRDRIAKSLRAGFTGFIGNPEDDDTTSLSMSARAVALLNSFRSQKLITDYTDLKIKRDDVDPRQWNISVRAQPTYPVNWIYVKVGIGLL